MFSSLREFLKSKLRKYENILRVACRKTLIFNKSFLLENTLLLFCCYTFQCVWYGKMSGRICITEEKFGERALLRYIHTLDCFHSVWFCGQYSVDICCQRLTETRRLPIKGTRNSERVPNFLNLVHSLYISAHFVVIQFQIKSLKFFFEILALFEVKLLRLRPKMSYQTVRISQ